MKSALFLQESIWKRQDRETYHRERQGTAQIYKQDEWHFVLFQDCVSVLVWEKEVKFEIGKS